MSGEEKELPASQKKLNDARKKGQVAKSTEFVSSSVTIMGFAYAMSQVEPLSEKFIDSIKFIGDHLNEPFYHIFPAIANRIVMTSLVSALPMLGVVVVTAILSNLFSTGGFIISFEPIMPKFDSLNPVSGFKKLFSVKKLIELIKNVAKTIAIGFASYFILKGTLQPLVEQPACGLRCAPGILRALISPLLEMGAIFLIVMGVFDIALQKWLFLRDQRMTKTEQKQEHKNSEGDPHVKGAIKRANREAMQSVQGMRKATFCIAGTGVLVAFRYSAGDTKVPTLVARGELDKAGELLADARHRGLPIHFDHAIARKLFEECKMGTPILELKIKSSTECCHHIKLNCSATIGFPGSGFRRTPFAFINRVL
jgi:type III secretion protein U